jgi:LPS-assembly lipoprotein
MLSSDHDHPMPRRFSGRVVLFALAAAFGLAACTVQPVYGPAPGGGAVSAALTRIAIDPVDERVAQVVRNKLIFGLTGGGAVSEPVYRLKLTTSVSEVALGVNPVDSAPSYAVTVAVTYELSKMGSTDIILRNTDRGTASYDRANQGFANVRAKIDAENRAAGVVAGNIRIRIAAAAATKSL